MMPSACQSATSSASFCFTSLDGTRRLYPVSVLPEIYERWFQELCGRPSPVETCTDCDDCNMLRPGEEEPFNRETRCCTYHPHLTPHLVGALLLQRSKIIEDKVAARDGVTPLGLQPNAEYSAV